MKVCFVTFRSITYAQRGQEVLSRAGINAAMTRTPRPLAEKGCGYSLKVPGEKREQAKALLRSNAVTYSKLYCPDPMGNLEEVP